MFSIIIPTYNGASKIPHLLESIPRHDSNTPLEIIVVVDGSTDNTLEMLENMPKTFEFMEQTNQGRSIARNAGIVKSKGSVCLFLDDDIRLTSPCFVHHVQHHHDFPNSILVGKVSMDKSLIIKDFDHYLCDLFEKWGNELKIKTLVTHDNFRFTSQNLSIPLHLIKSLGHFDARLTDAEDYDLGMRALEIGIPIYYDPEALAYHDDFPTCEKYISRQLEYKRAHQRLKDLGKQYAMDLFPPISSPKSKLKRWVLRIFSFTFWVRGIDRDFFLFLPEKVRFKLYSIVVYSHTLKRLGLI